MAYLEALAEAEGIEAKDSPALLRMDLTRKKEVFQMKRLGKARFDGYAEITKLKETGAGCCWHI